MRVKDLIKELQKCDPEAFVTVQIAEPGYKMPFTADHLKDVSLVTEDTRITSWFEPVVILEHEQ